MKVKTVLEQLPQSRATVYTALCQEGECTQTELAEKTNLTPRTVRRATTQLEENGLIEERVPVDAPRQRVYSVPSEY